METVTDLPHDIRTIENTFIPMSDGARLAARIWLPADAESHPVPAVLEYIPYRKRDLTRMRDTLNHPYLAGNGYASVRVDLRGSGDSDGVLIDEYRPQEHDDACEVIAWLAEQPWCDGNVGMMGISWGGFNSLQVAAHRPPALKAIVSASATEDLYHDNMHYMGGCLLGDNLSEATVMLAFNSLPPDPEIVGDRWRDMWIERLEGSGLWLQTWLEHQRRDDYWKPGSVRENYSAIACPVLAVGGWADGYTNAIFRLLEHLDVPRKGLIGPWGHKYPHRGRPGPAIGFLQELVRWWDHWLKGRDTGLMDEPMLRAWMQDSISPDPAHEERPGRWVAEPTWPSSNVDDRSFHLVGHRLVDAELADEPEERAVDLLSPLTVGSGAGKWASYAVPDLPSDQREEDGGSLVFESEPLGTETEVFGLPTVELEVCSDRPVAMVAVRLSDVRPNGEATRVTYGLLNLTHRDSNEHPEPLEPERRYRVTVQLNGIAHSFPAGHRIRVSMSTSYWPLAWPAPEPATLTVFTGPSLLRLPVRARRAVDEQLRRFEPPEAAAPLETTPLTDAERHWRIIRDLVTDTSTLEIVNDLGALRIEETGTTIHPCTKEWFSIRGNDVSTARAETRTERVIERPGWGISVKTRTVLTCTPTEFVLNAQVDAYDLDSQRGDPRVHSQTWNRSIPRDLV